MSALGAALLAAVLVGALAVRPGRVRPAAGSRLASSYGARIAVSSRVLTAVLVATLWVGFGPTSAVVGGAAVWCGDRIRQARARRSERSAIADAVPELIDLFRLAASAGVPVRPAVLAVAGRAPGPLRASLERAVRSIDRGASLAIGLAELDDALGPPGRALVTALDRSASTGAALEPLLADAASEARDARRRAAQEAARRLPVTLLFPLVGCTLPAALLLAVVPVVAVALGSLRG